MLCQANREKDRLEEKQRQERQRRQAAGEGTAPARWFEQLPARGPSEMPRWRYKVRTTADCVGHTCICKPIHLPLPRGALCLLSMDLALLLKKQVLSMSGIKSFCLPSTKELKPLIWLHSRHLWLSHNALLCDELGRQNISLGSCQGWVTQGPCAGHDEHYCPWKDFANRCK